jgi:hypothetical protein
MTDHQELFAALAVRQPTDAPDAPISVPSLVRTWLERGPAVFDGDDRASLEALCRQIDVRKKVSEAYGPGFARLDPETPADPAVVAGLVAVLLANAARVGDPSARTDGAVDDGWGLKCTNSAFKALDLRDDAPHASELRVWAIDVLDRHEQGAAER